MKKNVFLKPASILAIIGGALLIIMSFVTIIQIANIRVFQYYIGYTLVNVILIILSIVKIVFFSISLANIKKTYSKKTKKLYIVSTSINISIMLILLLDIIIAINMSNNLSIGFCACLLLEAVVMLFAITGIKNSVVDVAIYCSNTKENITQVKEQNSSVKDSVYINAPIENNTPKIIQNNNTSLDVLEKLYNLLQKGVITKEEYETKKNKILSDL